MKLALFSRKSDVINLMIVFVELIIEKFVYEYGALRWSYPQKHLYLQRAPTHWDQRPRRRAIRSPINRTNRYIREWKVNWSGYSTWADIQPKKNLYIGSGWHSDPN